MLSGNSETRRTGPEPHSKLPQPAVPPDSPGIPLRAPRWMGGVLSRGRPSVVAGDRLEASWVPVAWLEWCFRLGWEGDGSMGVGGGGGGLGDLLGGYCDKLDGDTEAQTGATAEPAGGTARV